MPIDSIGQLGYRISAEKPAELKADGAIVALAGGERLAFEGEKAALQLQCPWGRIDLPAGSLVKLQVIDPNVASDR